MARKKKVWNNLIVVLEAQKGNKKFINKIVKAYDPLVYKIASHYSRQYGVPIEDLLNIGRYAIVTAIKKFNPKKNTQFSTYAYSWVDAIIRRECKKIKGTVKIPLKKFAKSSKDLEEVKRALGIISLEENIPNETKEVSTLIADNRQVNPEDIVLEKDKEEYTKNIIRNILNAIEYEVFSMLVHRNMRNVDIAKKLGIHPMRVYRIKLSIQKKIRACKEL